MKNINVLLSACFMSMCFASGSEETTPFHQISRGFCSPSQVPPPFLQPTPGEKVSQNQSDLFENKQLFEKALPNEFENLLNQLGNSTEEKAKKWSILQNKDVSFENSEKRNYFRMVKHFFLSKSKDLTFFKDNDFYILQGKITEIDAKIKSVPEDRLKQLSEDYLKGLFGDNSKIIPGSKKDGSQIGIKMTVAYDYYIKTHSEGTQVSNSQNGSVAAAKQVKAVELLNYKILENLKIGPESHFFGRDDYDFYIMTLDASIDPESKKWLGKFTEFDKIKHDENILGCIANYNNSEKLSQEMIEEIEKDEKSLKFIKEVSKINIIMRILGLTDLHNNSSNFGFIINKNELMDLKIIDSRISNLDLLEGIKSFETGNGVYQSGTSTNSVDYAFKTRNLELRLEEANNIINSILINFESLLNNSKSEVINVMKKNIKDTESIKCFEIQLSDRCEGILNNYQVFKEKIPQKLNSIKTTT